MKFNTKKNVAVVLLIAATMVVSIVQGNLSNRWGSGIAATNAATTLVELPSEVGVWRVVEKVAMQPQVERILECAGYVNRIYRNEATGAVVRVAVIIGPAVPTSVHTPEICFSSRAFEQEEKRKRVEMGKEGDSLWALTFKRRDDPLNKMRVYYGWSSNGKWRAVENPRFEFMNQPYLYKLQLAATRAPSGTTSADEVCQSFLKEFLPQLREQLIPTTSS